MSEGSDIWCKVKDGLNLRPIDLNIQLDELSSNPLPSHPNPGNHELLEAPAACSLTPDAPVVSAQSRRPQARLAAQEGRWLLHPVQEKLEEAGCSVLRQAKLMYFENDSERSQGTVEVRQPST